MIVESNVWFRKFVIPMVSIWKVMQSISIFHNSLYSERIIAVNHWWVDYVFVKKPFSFIEFPRMNLVRFVKKYFFLCVFFLRCWFIIFEFVFNSICEDQIYKCSEFMLEVFSMMMIMSFGLNDDQHEVTWWYVCLIEDQQMGRNFSDNNHRWKVLSHWTKDNA